MKITLTIDVPGGKEDAYRNRFPIRRVVENALIDLINYQRETNNAGVSASDGKEVATVTCQAIYQ